MAIAKRKNAKVTTPKAQSGKTTSPKDTVLTDKQRQEKVDALIGELRSAQFPGKKKKIRRSLRALGHLGGLKSIDTKK